jgi:hypothetical protein
MTGHTASCLAESYVERRKWLFRQPYDSLIYSGSWRRPAETSGSLKIATENRSVGGSIPPLGISRAG